MELRVHAGARATKDLDTVFREGIEAVADPSIRRFGPGTATSPRGGLSSSQSVTQVRSVATSSWPTAVAR